MKKIEAIIRATKFESVKEELSKIGVNFFTYYEVRGFGIEKGKPISYRGALYDMGYIARYKIEILVESSKVDEVISCITTTAQTGHVGDGKVLVYDIEKVVRIRTGEIDEKAV
jgi:nitrogen regulatory protein PII